MIMSSGQNYDFCFNSTDVLRTYRRAAGGERKAGVNFETGFLQKFMHHVNLAFVVKHGASKRQQNVEDEPERFKKQRTSVQHSVNLAGFGFHFGQSWPPLRKEKQYVNASIKCSGV